MKIILLERGEDLVLLDPYKYRFIWNPKNSRIKWKCSNNKYTASILTDSDKKVLIERLSKHNHSKIPTSTIKPYPQIDII